MSDNIFFQSLELLDASKLTPQELANNRIMELAPATDPTIILF